MESAQKKPEELLLTCLTSTRLNETWSCVYDIIYG